MFGDLPAVSLARLQIYVCNERSIFPRGSIQQCDGIFARRSYGGLKTTIGKALLDQALNELIIFDDQNNYLIFHLEPTVVATPPQQQGTRGGKTIVPDKVSNIAQ